MIDDVNAPSEILVFDEKGNKTGIDLLAYCGYLQAGLKETILKIEELERGIVKIIKDTKRN